MIDCDKNKYPDVITSLKDPRNWAQNPNELIEFKDHVYFTPNFLQMFDFVNYTDSTYLKLLAQFNAVQLGFRLSLYKHGKFDPANNDKYLYSECFKHFDFFSLRCNVGSPQWKKEFAGLSDATKSKIPN